MELEVSLKRERVAIDLTKKRWLVLIASCLINLCIGATYAWSVFSTPMAEYLSSILNKTITAGDLSTVFTVANAVGPITMISGGWVNDKIGPRWVIFIGGLFFGLGMLLSGFASSIWMLDITFGLGCGLGMGLVYGCTVNNSIKFFPDKRGLIGGIAAATYGLSSVFIPPIANGLLGAMGVLNAFRIIGIVFLIVICSMAFLVEKCPENFIPTGWETKDTDHKANSLKSKNYQEMLKDPIFYVMLFMLVCGAFSGLMVISQVSPIAQQMIGVSPAIAATTVSVLALFNATGRVAAGFISDKIGRIKTLAFVFCLSMIGLIFLSISQDGTLVRFIIGVSIVGVCFGSFMGIFPAFTAEQFGSKYNSMNYGIMFIGFAVAGVVGPIIVGSVFARYSSYKLAFLIAMGLAIIGLILCPIYTIVKQRNI